jgi:hypothetical protein
MTIAFTIGSTKNYIESITNNTSAKKLGKSEDYLGGWVWKTREEAEQFIRSNQFLKTDWGDGKLRDPNCFSVFGLLINDWDSDTYKSTEDGQYHLLIDAKLFMI